MGRRTRKVFIIIIIIVIKTLFHDGKNTLQPEAEKPVALKAKILHKHDTMTKLSKD